MVRNIVLLSGNSHPALAESVCKLLGISPCERILTKFSCGETRCEIKDSVRGKDVFIIQSGGGAVNDHFVELCIMISACKTGSAKRITAITPLFPYSRQPDVPYRKSGAPLSKLTSKIPTAPYTFESVPATPGPECGQSAAFNSSTDLNGFMGRANITIDGDVAGPSGSSDLKELITTEANPGYKRWVAQPGNLVADLLTCAGADHVVAIDLHDAQYQGYFDNPMDNLYARPLLSSYIMHKIPGYKEAVIVSPDAGGAKRASSVADSLGMDVALIHKERRPTKITARQNATMMLVGNVKGRICILVDDLADTANTITRAAKLVHREGATKIYALLTHGILSGDAIARINASAIDKVVVTNSVPQEAYLAACPKLEVLDVAPLFSEAIRRIHHGESISSLFQM